MAKLIIPPAVIDGFKEIANLTDNQINTLADYLNSIEVGTQFDDIDKFINTQLDITNSTSIVKTIIGFGELLEGQDVKYSELAHDLKESVSEALKNGDKVNLDALESNLIKIFENSKNLRLSLKVLNLLLENSNVYIDSRIISDIRLIFNDNLTDINRNGVIIHRLHLSVQNLRTHSDIILTMDGSDLKKLKDVLDRALLKEEIIKEDYENIHFIKQ